VSITRGVIWQGTEAIVRPPKSRGSSRLVPLPQRANAIIKRHLAGVPADPEALLFPRGPGMDGHKGEHQIRTVWNFVRAQAGFSGRFHSLRAYAATEFGKTGATAIELMSRFGHRDVETAMRYQRTTGRELELLDQLDQLG
jgi:integrase